MEMKSLLSCCICYLLYDDKRLPKNLSCGHVVCSECLEKLLHINEGRDYFMDETNHCPECRQTIKDKKVCEMSINFSMLRISRFYAFENTKKEDSPEDDLKLPTELPSCRSEKENAGVCPTHKDNTLFFMCVRCCVFVCRDCFLEDHRDPPFGNCSLMNIEDAIEKIKKSHMKVLNKYMNFLSDRVDNISRLLRKLRLSLKYLDTSENADGSINIKCTDELKKQIDYYSMKLLPSAQILESLKNVKEKLSDVHKNPLNVFDIMDESNKCQLFFENYEKNLEEEEEMPNVIDIIFGSRKTFRNLLDEINPIYVISENQIEIEVDGADETKKIRWAPIYLKDDRVLLFSLRDGTPPDNGIKIPFEVLRDMVPNESPWVFLEIERREEIKGRVYVRLFGNTPRSRQTLYLCSGEKGPSYQNTCFYKVETTDYGIHHICGGDYENNDGTGGRAIVEGITSGGPYCQYSKVGLFVSWGSQDTWRLGSFDIYLNERPDIVDYSAHGMVEEGIEIIQEAANTTPVTETSVGDCGIVIPL